MELLSKTSSERLPLHILQFSEQRLRKRADIPQWRFTIVWIAAGPRWWLHKGWL